MEDRPANGLWRAGITALDLNMLFQSLIQQDDDLHEGQGSEVPTSVARKGQDDQIRVWVVIVFSGQDVLAFLHCFLQFALSVFQAGVPHRRARWSHPSHFDAPFPGQPGIRGCRADVGAASSSRIKGFYACLFDAFELMPGMIIVVQDIEKAFLDVDLSCDEIFAIAQEGTDLLLDSFKWQQAVLVKMASPCSL